tara:strand:- start:254 stop:1153 length:900 start_codon:yes stop_codon:yes gene_type:complete
MALNSDKIIGVTILAALPGLVTMSVVWGMGIVQNILWMLLFAALIDLTSLKLKAKPATQFRNIYPSSALTVLLIAIGLPPAVTPGVLLVACLSSLGLAREAYGGIGRNVFNPAMVGYAVIFLAYPQQLAIWPSDLNGLSGATLLTEFKYRESLTISEFLSTHESAQQSSLMVACSFFLGGIFLLYKKIITWHIPLTIMATIVVLAQWGYDSGSSQSDGSPWFHLTAGGLVATAFFIATDPVTHPLRKEHQVFFAFIVASVIYLVRTEGSFPDGIAFAILFANCFTPIMNRYHLTRKTAE